MALRFRNERIITSLRASYLSHRHEDSLLLGDGLDTGTPMSSQQRAEPPTQKAATQNTDEILNNSVSNLDSNPLKDRSNASSDFSNERGLRGGLHDQLGDPLDDTLGDPLDDPLGDPLGNGLGDPLGDPLGDLSFESDSSFENSLVDTLHTPVSLKSSPVKPAIFRKTEFSKPSLSSHLTAQLQTVNQDPKEQYLEAVAGISQSSDSNSPSVTLKIHMDEMNCITITVKRDCSAHLALGYALYKAGIEPGDSNMYNLHLAEDDGSIDHDFPALDRNRPVASYHADELAVSIASESEYAANCKLTPNKLPFNRPKLHHRESSRMTLKPIKRTSTNQECVIVQMFMSPYDELLSQPFWVSPNLSLTTNLFDVFEQMCWDKMMDLDMYVIRAVGSRDLKANLQSRLATYKSLITQDHRLMFEIIALRSLKKPDPKPTKPDSAKRNADNKPTDSLQNAVMAMQPLGFYKYPVLRRQQMNFLGRSERELIIDGEYIHLMPPADWSVIDQPKTTTFHIRQVLKVKQSRKNKTNVSIVVMKASGPKRYDLECANSGTAFEIVDRLKRLRQAIHKAML